MYDIIPQKSRVSVVDLELVVRIDVEARCPGLRSLFVDALG
jgi:hypothetical protein